MRCWKVTQPRNQQILLCWNNDNSKNNRIQRRNSSCFVLFVFFNNLFTAPRTVSNTYAQVARVQSCAKHVQHIGHDTHYAQPLCHSVRRDSSATKTGRTEITFVVILFHWLKWLSDEAILRSNSSIKYAASPRTIFLTPGMSVQALTI